MEELLAQTDPARGRSFVGNVAAGSEAATGMAARGGAGFLNKIPSGLLDLLPFGFAMHPEDQPFSDPIVSDATTEQISQDALDAQGQVGGSQVAKAVEMGQGLAPMVAGPVGIAGYAAQDFGNRRVSSLEAGESEFKATTLGVAQAIVDVVAPGVGGRVAGGVAKKLGGALVADAAAPTAQRVLSRFAAPAVEQGIHGAAAGEALNIGSAGVTALSGDTADAVKELQDPTAAILGLVAGGAGGAFGGRTAARAEARRNGLLDQYQQHNDINAAFANAQRPTPTLMDQPSTQMASDIIGQSLPQMGDGVEFDPQGRMRVPQREAPYVESFQPPEEQMRAEGAAELERMDAEAQAQRQHSQMVDESQANAEVDRLRQQHADDLARLGYPVPPDPMVVRQQREQREAQARADQESFAAARERHDAQHAQTDAEPRPPVIPPLTASPRTDTTAVPPEAPVAFADPLTEARVRRGTEGGDALPTVRARRAAFAADPEGRAKVAKLTRAGATIPEVTQLIDHGQFDRAVASLDQTPGADRQAIPGAPPAGAAVSGSVGEAPATVSARAAASGSLAQRALEARQAAQERRPSGAAPTTALERPAPATGRETALPAENESLARQALDAPDVADADLPPDTAAPAGRGPAVPPISASADATPLAVHEGLAAPKAVLDPARRPPPEPASDVHPLDRENALGANQPYKGNKEEGEDSIVSAARGTLGEDAKKVTVVYDPFGGGGGHGVAITHLVTPNAKTLVVGESSPSRLAKIRFIHEQGKTLRQRATETGVYSSLRQLWERLIAGGGRGSGGAIQGRVSDRVIDEFYGPNGDGTKTLPPGIDPNEAKALMHAYVDGMERGVKPDFDALIAKAERSAARGHEAAEMLRQKGVKIEYVPGDAFAQRYPSGPHNLIVMDPPYYGTTGYDEGRGMRSGAELYGKTAKMVEDARRRGNSFVYTDEAWWAKGTDDKPAVTPSEAKQGNQILDRIQTAADRWAFYDVGRRTESVAVTNGFKPESHPRVYDAERQAFQEARRNEAVSPEGVAPVGVGKSSAEPVELKAKPRDGVVEAKLRAEAEKDLAVEKQRLQVSRERGRITREQAEDSYQKKVDQQIERLRERLPPAERQAHDVERATSERQAELRPDTTGERRKALKAALEARKLPGEVVDHPLGVAVKLKNGTQILFMDADIPEQHWNAKNWLASLLASEGGAAKFTALAEGVYRKRVTGDAWLKMSRPKQMELMRKLPPVAGLMEANGKTLAFDSDFVVRLGKVVDSLISGGKSGAIDEELAQAMWRLMPEGDRQAVLPDLQRFALSKLTETGSPEAEEAFAQWAQRKRAELKPLDGERGGLFGKALRAVRSFISRIFGKGQPPLVKRDVAEDIYQRVKGNDYFAGKPEALRPEASSAGEAPTMRQAAEQRKERFSLEQDARESMQAEQKDRGERESVSDEERQRGVADRKRQLGGVEEQRAEAHRIVDSALETNSSPTADDQAYVRSVIDDLSKALSERKTPQALERYLALATKDALVGTEMGDAFRQRRFDLESEEGRRAYAHYNIHQLRGADREAYTKALKAYSKAQSEGRTELARRMKAKIDGLEAKSAEMHRKLREKILRKYDVDIAGDNLGSVFRSRYQLDNLLATVAAHRSDWTVGDLITTSFRQGVLSWPGTVMKNITGNFPNYIRHVLLKPALETAMGGKSLDELGHIYGGVMPGLKMAWQNMIDSYKAGYDVIENTAVHTKTGLGVENTHGVKAPSIVQLLTGLDLSYVSTRAHVAADAFFKAWAGYSLVASEAHKGATEQGMSGAERGDHISQVLRDGPENDHTGAWMRGYRQAKKVTFQETFDKELTPEWMTKKLQSLSDVVNTRIPTGLSIKGHAIDIQPGVMALPFIGTPFGIHRQAAQLFAPLQALKMVVRGMGGGYSEGGHATLRGDAADLVLGTALMAGLYGLVSPDDDKTWFTGSEPKFGSGESNLQRRGGTPPPRSMWMGPLGWRSFDAIQPLSAVATPIIDLMRGKGAGQAVSGAKQMWLLSQMSDAIDMATDLSKTATWSPKGWVSDDPHVAHETNEATRHLRHFVASSVAGIAVPNLIRRGLTTIEDMQSGVETPRESRRLEPGESTAEHLGKNIMQELLPGVAADNAPPVSDVYGRDVINRLSSISELPMHLLGLSSAETPASEYDQMLIRWNKRVSDEGLRDPDGTSKQYYPQNWKADFLDRRGGKHYLDDEQYRKLSVEAGAEFTRRLDKLRANGHLNLDNPGERDIERYKAVKSAVAEWAETRLARSAR